MKTITEHLRHSLHEQAGLLDQPKMPTLKELYATQWFPEFEQLMRNRMVMGAYRYGLISETKAAKYDRIASVKKRLVAYEESGNTEYLVDCANLLMLEFEMSDHPNKHFESIDDGEHVEGNK